MTPAEALSLARRWAACPGFHWRAGMITQHGERVVTTDGAPRGRALLTEHNEEDGRQWYEVHEAWMGDGGPRVPDLSDAATAGCLLADAREAWGDPNAVVDYHPERGWKVLTLTAPDRWDTLTPRCDSEAEALIAALEAAPAAPFRRRREREH